MLSPGFNLTSKNTLIQNMPKTFFNIDYSEYLPWPLFCIFLLCRGCHKKDLKAIATHPFFVSKQSPKVATQLQVLKEQRKAQLSRVRVAVGPAQRSVKTQRSGDIQIWDQIPCHDLFFPVCFRIVNYVCPMSSLKWEFSFGIFIHSSYCTKLVNINLLNLNYIIWYQRIILIFKSILFIWCLH